MKDLTVKLRVDGSGVFPAFATLEKKASDLATRGFGRLKSALAGAFTVGAITAYTKSTMDWAGHLTDVATRLGVSTEYIQEMEFALKQSGASMDDLVSFTEKLNRARSMALSGGPKGQKVAEIFKTQFGLDADTLKGPVQPIIDAIAKQFESGNVQVLTTALSNIGIKGAGAMTAAFADGINDGRSTARKVGAVLAEDIVEQLDIAGDQLSAFAMILRSEFAPSLVWVARKIIETVGWIKGSAAFLGGGTAKWSAKDYLKKVLYYTSPLAMLTGKSPGNQFDYSTAGTMQQEEDEKTKALLRGIDEQVKSRTERRKRSGLGTFDPAIQAATRGASVSNSSDSLISVGNFLGHGRSAMQTLAQETNNILKRMDEKLGELVNKSSDGPELLGIAEEG